MEAVILEIIKLLLSSALGFLGGAQFEKRNTRVSGSGNAIVETENSGNISQLNVYGDMHIYEYDTRKGTLIQEGESELACVAASGDSSQ